MNAMYVNPKHLRTVDSDKEVLQILASTTKLKVGESSLRKDSLCYSGRMYSIRKVDNELKFKDKCFEPGQQPMFSHGLCD